MADDVEIVRALYESWQAGDTEAAFGDFAEGIEWDARGIGAPRPQPGLHWP